MMRQNQLTVDWFSQQFLFANFKFKHTTTTHLYQNRYIMFIIVAYKYQYFNIIDLQKNNNATEFII